MTGDNEDDNPEGSGPKGFDDFDLRLGDIMRGERATMGKSLLDVQRELRIKASYIAAIENADPSAFDTPGFIAGYVRSYARYLGLDPDETFSEFCNESGFTVAHGMSVDASVIRDSTLGQKPHRNQRDPLLAPHTPFMPESGGLFSHLEPRAIGSLVILVGLIAGIGLGGWTVLKQVQQVKFAPVDQTPMVLSDLDPLSRAGEEGDPSVPTAEALDRLYRPPALDVPVLVARDAPISTLDPREVGTFQVPNIRSAAPSQIFADQIEAAVAAAMPQVVAPEAPALRMVAVRPSWVRVRAADGTVIYEGIMESGQTYEVPAMEEPPTLRAGESGAIYFAMDGAHYGPIGKRGMVTSNLALSAEEISAQFQVADLEQDQDLARMVAEAQTDSAVNSQ
nr:helix-turn-helix domain-containing protein [Pontibaca salina]